MPDATPPDALLAEQNASLREEIKTLKEQIDQLKQFNHVLRLKVDAMARKLFGRSSESLDPAQLQMVFDALQNQPPGDEPKKPEAFDSPACGSEAEAAATPAARRKKRTLEQTIESLPVIETIIEPDEVIADPQAWTCIGSEETKLVDYIRGYFQCQKLIRRKYVRNDARHQPPIIAPLRTLQPRCIASPRLLAHTIAARFEQHLPYYRIEQQYARLGVPLPRHTLCGWTGMAHDACTLIIDHLKRDLFADGYVQADETPVKYQDPEREGVCGTGWLWTFHNPMRNVSLFAWRTGRGADALQSIIPAKFEGIIQCDGHSAYEALIKRPEHTGKIALAGCMAHARRKFFEAKDESEDARWMLAQMQSLYRIEARLREARAGPEDVLNERQLHSAAIIARIKERLEALHQSRKHLPRSLTGEALTYARNQRDKLCAFLRDGRVQIDNNLVENAIRPSAIGKKNWLFMGDKDSGARAATFYTLIGNCHRESINAEAYLADVFERLPKETNQTVHRLTPKAWATEQAALKQALLQSAMVQV